MLQGVLMFEKIWLHKQPSAHAQPITQGANVIVQRRQDFTMKADRPPSVRCNAVLAGARTDRSRIPELSFSTDRSHSPVITDRVMDVAE
jgi:hypothetical protein